LTSAAAALCAVALAGGAGAQPAAALAGVWTPAERSIPDPLPLRSPAAPARPAPCAAPGMPALLDTHGAIEISAQADRLRFRYAEWGSTRTIYTDPRNRPPAQEPSPLGVSFGRWEGATLAVFTTYIAYPYFDRAGTAQSPAVTVLERYTPSADRARVDWKITVTDAATFAEPVVMVGALTRAQTAVTAPALVAGDCVR
jgi:hypothetical protein